MTTVTYNMRIPNMLISCVNDFQRQDELYAHISSLEQEYPFFMDWYYNTVLPGTTIGLRKIIVATIEDNIAGVLILKDASEKKICTLRVESEYRGNGLGHRLMNIAIRELKTEYPLITVSDIHIDEFMTLFRDNKFRFSKMYFEKYIKGHYEIAFNGYL